MPVAYLPSPAREVWHLGPIPVRGYALCAIAGVLVALWLTDRRYRRMGGPSGMVLDVAAVAVPAGIIGARIYAVLTDYHAYFGAGRDWVAVFRLWDGGLGTAGLIGAGAIGAWAYCRHYGYALAPIALAATPALAVGQAIGAWGNWFGQRLYGAPSSLPWAVAIDPVRRANDYESFSTFQPVFLYQSLWDLLIAAAVAYAIRRFLLTGDRAFALYAGLYAAGRFVCELLRIDTSPHLLGIRVTEGATLVVAAGSVCYLALSRARQDRLAPAAAPAARPPATSPAPLPALAAPAVLPAPAMPALATPARTVTTTAPAATAPDPAQVAELTSDDGMQPRSPGLLRGRNESPTVG
ncbi:MAG TPA: prolipoprotein diacylglyceryl transferase family protein [Streptosporangiaceae bacterium]|jgi:prolipoprotein diacylglyceryl transferase